MPDEKPLISLTVCVRDGVDWVDGCIESLKAQTYRPIEILAVDDGSRDGSKEKFDKHLKDEDFFDVDKFPEAKLSFNRSSINKDGTKTLSCTLDMHGVAVDYEIPFKIKAQKLSEGGMGYNITGEFFMDRTKHELTYGSGSFIDNLGNRAINDDVLISFAFLAL